MTNEKKEYPKVICKTFMCVITKELFVQGRSPRKETEDKAPENPAPLLVRCSGETGGNSGFLCDLSSLESIRKSNLHPSETKATEAALHKHTLKDSCIKALYTFISEKMSNLDFMVVC